MSDAQLFGDVPTRPPRKKREHPEANIQIQCRLFCQQNILCPFEFLGFDRSQAKSAMSHEYERRRGLRAGQSDTQVKALGFVAIWIEVKDTGKKPTDTQYEFGEDMVRVGDAWAWADSVTRYAEELHAHGIPLRNNWRINAEHLDRLLLAGKMKRAAGVPKKKRSSKFRTEKPSGSQLRVAHRGWALGRK